MGPVRAVVPDATPSSPVYRVLPGFDPRFREHAVLTSGDWPAPVDGQLDGGAAVEIVLADAVAERMEWGLGEERFIGIGAVNQPLRLAGTIAPADADAGFWTHVPSSLEPSVIDNGLAPPEITATAFVDATAWTAFSQVNLPVIMQAWIPVLPERITADETDATQGPARRVLERRADARLRRMGRLGGHRRRGRLPERARLRRSARRRSQPPRATPCSRRSPRDRSAS